MFGQLGLGLGLGGSVGGARIVSPDHAWLLEQVGNTFPSLYDTVEANLLRTAYRQDSDQYIRNAFGFLDTETFGTQVGVAIGSSGTLTAGTGGTINNEGNISLISDSGTGTDADPYVVDSKLYDGGGATTRAFIFQDTDADYHILIRNCEFKEYTSNLILMGNQPNVTFENCTFSNSGNVIPILYRGAGTVFRNCLFAGFGHSIQGVFPQSLGNNISYTIINCKWDNSIQDSPVSANCLYCDDTQVTITAQYLDFALTGITNEATAAIRISRIANGSSFQNFKVRGNVTHGVDDQGSNEENKTITIRYFDIVDTKEECLFLKAINDSTVKYGFLERTSGRKARLFTLGQEVPVREDQYPFSIDTDLTLDGNYIGYIKHNKTTGNNEGGEENIQWFLGSNNTFEYLWGLEAVEDMYEWVYSLGGNIWQHCIADNVPNQAYDFYKLWDAGTQTPYDFGDDISGVAAFGDYVHHLYGSSVGRFGLSLDGLNGAFAHDIYVDNTDGTDDLISVREIYFQRSKNVYIAGPLSNNIASGEIYYIGAIDSAAQWVDGSGLNTLSTDDQPVNTVAPVLSGTYGAGNTLTCTQGTWTTDGGATYTYAFYRGADDLLQSSAATTYVMTAEDVSDGGAISCNVVASENGMAETARSNLIEAP